MFPVSGLGDFSCVLEAVGTPPFVVLLGCVWGAGRACVTELFFGKQPQGTSKGANMGILRRIVRIT